MRVFLAEKRSVAEALALEVGDASPGEGCYRAGNDIFTWALGHLLELAPPEYYEASWKRWRSDHLPILPEKLATVPVEKKQLRFLQRLIAQEETEEVVNACDAGREGELIFAWILESAGRDVQKKYKKRLWLSSLTPDAIRQGLDNLQPAKDFRPLREAARARSEADWLLGINATRAATLALRNLDVVSLGRVQTPTLALIVRREEERQRFQEEKFWTIEASFVSQNGAYKGQHEIGRTKEEAAKKIIKNLGKEATVLQIKKESKSEKPPLLYDLTALQREASSRWSWPAARTLSLAQELYEKEKVLSYPRTDSRYLPESFPLKEVLPFLPDIKMRKQFDRVLRDSGVSDHHALIPVGEGGHLSGDHKKLFRLVCYRVAAALSPDALLEKEEIITDLSGEKFLSKGRRYKALGWREFEEQKESFLPDLSQGERVVCKSLLAREGATKPPPRYSDGTLLSAMETAGKHVDDALAREAMKEHGLGTPATRASILEKLLRVGYLSREGKSLLPTEKGQEVVRLLEGSDLLRAELTGRWERDLREIEKGKDREKFDQNLRQWVAKETAFLLQLPPVGQKDWGKCPGCGKGLLENRSAISCWKKDDPGCGFALWKKVAGRKLSAGDIQDLLRKGRTKKLTGFRARSGKKFSAALRLEKTKEGWKTVFDLGS